MPAFTQKAYVNKMLPHLLPKEARKRGIKQSNKAAWKSLAKEIKEKLKVRYCTALEADLYSDISFNNKGISHVPSDTQYRINDKVVSRLTFVSKDKLDWIRETRIDLLSKAVVGEVELVKALTRRGIDVWQKAPFVFEGKTSFAGIFIPSGNLVVEIDKYGKSPSLLFGNAKQRIQDFEAHGIKYMLVRYNARSIDAIVRQILANL